MEESAQFRAPAYLIHGLKALGSYWMEGWVGPKTGPSHTIL
jgi:hypothetical protein